MGHQTNLANAGTVISRESALYFVGSWRDVSQSLAVDLFGLGAQSGDGKDLTVLVHSLLKLAEQDAQSWRKGLAFWEVGEGAARVARGGGDLPAA